MKTILYATDYSKKSVAALKYAYSLSKDLKATLMVIHVFDYPTMLDHFSLKPEDPFPDLEANTIKKHNLKLNAFCKENLGTNFEKSQVKVEAIEDKSVLHGITKKASELPAYLIIIGMKGESALKEIIMGSTAQHLLQNSPCPVLTIPEDASHTKMKSIVYATDFEEEDIGAINKLTEIAEPLQATITIVHVFPINKKLTKKEEKGLIDDIHKMIKYPKLEVDILYSDDILQTLKIYYSKSENDLIAMLERETPSIVLQVFQNNFVKKMESYGKIPLITFNAKNYRFFHL